MKIKKEDLQNALEVVKPGLANKEIIEQSTSFAFLGDRVVTYNDQISLSHPIEGMEVTGAVKAEQLYEFLKRVKAKEIQLKTSDNELLMKAGRSKAGLTYHADIVLPLEEVDDNKDWQDLGEEFTANLMFVKDSASSDMTREVLTCVHVNDKFMEASNGFQIMRLTHDGWPLSEVLIPADIIPEINKIEPAQVAETNGWVHFRNMGGTILSARIMNDTYPDTSPHIEMTGKKIMFPEVMPEILDRAMVFTKRDHFMDEEMSMTIKGKKILVHGKNDGGWFKEQAPIKYEGDTAQFWITPSLLKDVLKRSSTGELNSEKLKFSGEDWEYIAVLKEGDV